MTDTNLGAAAGDIFAKAFTLGYETGRTLLTDNEQRLTAEQVEDVRALVWLDGRRNFDAFHRLRARFPATEPAEAAKPRSFEVGDQEPEDRVTIILRGASRGGVAAEFRFGRYATTGLHDNPGAWWRTDQDEPIYAPWDFWLEQFGPLTEVQPAPAEPAEEETKAEESAVTVCDETQKAYDEAVSLSYWLAKQLGEHVDDAYDRGETLTDTVQRLIEHIRPNLGKTKTASSPVVPAPTETGPWPSLNDVPAEVSEVWDANGDGWLRRSDIEWFGCAEGGITSACRAGHPNLAPFVAAEEGRA